MILETGLEAEEEPHEIDKLSKLKVVIEKQKNEIKKLAKNLEIAKLEIKKNELLSRVVNRV